MKRLVLISVLVITGVAVLAQPRLKYKELLPILQTASVTEQSTLIWEYVLADLNHPNANLRFSLLYFQICMDSDPLVEYERAMGHARECHLRMLVAQHLVTAQEVRSNDDYYMPMFGKADAKGKLSIEFPTIQKRMKDVYDSALEFRRMMPPIYTAFTKSVNFYDRAVKKFAQLNTDYKSLEDLLMLFDDNVDKELGDLKSLYDSSVHYFDQYRSLIKVYPISHHPNHNYHLRPIMIYRLDGLTTRLNFLTNDVELWNYGVWVDDVRKVYSKDVAGLKEKISTNDAKLTESLIGIQKPDNKAAPSKLEKDVVFKLNNYDKNSLALSLLEYKTFKQQLLGRARAIGTDSLIDIKLELYSDLLRLNRSADSLCKAVRYRMNATSIKKHKTFIDSYYGGEAGLEKYLHDETEWIDGSYKQYQGILKGNLFASTQPPDQINVFFKYNTFNIPLFTQKKSVSQLDNVSLLTVKQMRSPDGSLYVAGVHRLNRKTNTLTAYVARVNPGGKTGWMKEFTFLRDSSTAVGEDNYIGDIALTQEGCAVVVSVAPPGATKVANVFLYLNEKGEEKLKRKLKDTKLCRKVIYQETSSTFVMAFKGTSEFQDFQTEEPISLTSINVLGDPVWRREISLAGTIQDVVPVRDGYVVIGNFSTMRDLTGTVVRTKLNLGQSNPYLIKLSTRGELVNITPITTPKTIYIDTIVKVNDGSINLLGYESSFTVMNDPNSLKGNVLHMMVGYDLKKICADF